MPDLFTTFRNSVPLDVVGIEYKMGKGNKKVARYMDEVESLALR